MRQKMKAENKIMTVAYVTELFWKLLNYSMVKGQVDLKYVGLVIISGQNKKCDNEWIFS